MKSYLNNDLHAYSDGRYVVVEKRAFTLIELLVVIAIIGALGFFTFACD